MDIQIDRLEALGLKAAASNIKQEATIREKLAIAYEKYRYLSEEKLTAFNDKLRKESEQATQYQTIYKRIKMTALADYPNVPPSEVLDKLEAAMADGCFDKFEVMTIDWVKEVKDPILFGVIEGCSDLFVIGQWDDDVKIEDILNDHEGWKFLEKH